MVDDINTISDTNKIHIRIKQRNTRKVWTIVENITLIKSGDKELEEVLKHLKRSNHCNGSIEIDAELQKKVIILQGDKRQEVKEYLMSVHNISKTQISIHG